MRELINMDEGWRFHLGDIIGHRNRWAWAKSGSWNQGPESMEYEDQDWREVTLPHDYVFEGEPKPYLVNEFSTKENAIPEMQSVINMHTTAGSFPKEIGWYRKHFYIPKEDEGKKLFFVFDGIYRDSCIYLNNFFVKQHRSGYTGIKCDITDFVNYGGNNVIAVRMDPRESEGWFYEGGGIYRHTYLWKMEENYIDQVFVKSTVDKSNTMAIVTIETELVVATKNQTGFILCTEIFSPGGTVVGTVKSEITGNFCVQKLMIEQPMLWDVEEPNCYRAVSQLYEKQTKYDELSTTFGIRTISFDAVHGFFLNGRNLKIKGVCCHQNHGGLGIALPDELYTYRIKKLKEMGCNAYRTSHYPPSPALLDACDRLGMLVIDETRLLSSAEEDLEQLEFLVKRDRNHPAVILYCIGNEEAQSQTTPQGGRIATTMVKRIKELDDTRFVTMGLLMWNLAEKKRLESVCEIAAISKQLDVAGFNYHNDRWGEFREAYPKQPMISTENTTFRSTRGCYQTDTQRCHLSILDETDPSYMMGAKYWKEISQPYMSGAFLWTGFDYYGEPTPYAWPAISSQFGIMDLCGYPKDCYYYYKSWWGDEPVLHLFPNWNGVPGEKKHIVVFSNCEEVELVVNDVSLGRKRMEPLGYLEWEGVTYIPGALTAIGYQEGSVLLKETVRTTGEGKRVTMELDHREGEIAIIQVSVQDQEGQLVPDSNHEISVSLTGKAELLGASNGDPSDHTAGKAKKRRVFHGLAQIILKVKGEFSITAVSEGLLGSKLIGRGE